MRTFVLRSDILITLANAVMCRLIMLGSFCWGGLFQKMQINIE